MTFLNLQGYVSWKHEDDKVIVFDRADLVFVFNFHPVKSFADYPVGVKNPGTYKVVLCSDDEQFGGERRVDTSVKHFTQSEQFSAYQNKMMIYIPRRTALVYAQTGNVSIHFVLILFVVININKTDYILDR